MAKLMLLKKNEISVPEERKGKQIAVKESNIVALKDFFSANYKLPEQSVEQINDSVPIQTNETITELEPTALEDSTVLPEQEEISAIPNQLLDNNINPDPIPMPNPEEQIINLSEPSQNNIEANSKQEEEEQAVNFEIENKQTGEESINVEELDPELKEIKNRLDKVIEDLNNYKKKIKILENEVNQNLEKSREVLKDTQAAAQIMSIQQERQRAINEEMNSSTNAEDDQTRILQNNNVA